MTFSSVGIVGSGPVGCAIAIAVARGGTPVTLVRASRGASKLAARRIGARLDYFRRVGELDDDDVERIREAIAIDDDLARLTGCDLVIETAPGDERARRAVLATLEPRLSASTVLASNTAPEHLDAIAEALARRDQFVGLCFFRGERRAARAPEEARGGGAVLRRFVELGLTADTAPGVAAACRAFAERLGTTTIEHRTGTAAVGYREFLSGGGEPPHEP